MLGHNGDLGTIYCSYLGIQVGTKLKTRIGNKSFVHLALQILQLSFNDLHHVSI